MTKKVAKEKRISDILAAAVSEFSEKGYEATSLDSIAARAGLTKGGLYYHFKSKDDVLVRANERFLEPVLEIMAAAARKTSAAKCVTEERFARLFHGYTGQIIGFLDDLYRRGIAAGEFRAMNSRSVAIALMAALDGIIGYIILDGTLDLGATINDFITAFITTHTPEGFHES